MDSAEEGGNSSRGRGRRGRGREKEEEKKRKKEEEEKQMKEEVKKTEEEEEKKVKKKKNCHSSQDNYPHFCVTCKDLGVDSWVGPQKREAHESVGFPVLL